MLRDAARIVPEIGELAAAVLHPDAVLIDAEIGIAWCLQILSEPPNPKMVEVLGEEHQRNRRVGSEKAAEELAGTAHRRGTSLQQRLPVIRRVAPV